MSGGLVTDVEARGCGQCFSGYPMTDLTFRGNTCAQPLCPSKAAEMGLKRYRPAAVMYTAGDNHSHWPPVLGSNITVEDGFFYEPCEENMQPYWESRKGEIFANGGPELIELEEWVPKQPRVVHFDLMDCGTEAPKISCKDFPV